MRRLCGGGGLQVHNHATSWPNLQEGSCKNSSKAEFQVGPECGNNCDCKTASIFGFVKHTASEHCDYTLMDSWDGENRSFLENVRFYFGFLFRYKYFPG